MSWNASRQRGVTVAIAIGLLTWSSMGWAAVPAQVQFEGLLKTGAGTPVSDGTYAMVFSLYGDAKGSKPLWSEGPVQVKTSGGALMHSLGSVKALDLNALATATDLHVGVKVGNEPELPRQPIRSVVYALHAGHAATADASKSLSCTGCVSTKALKFDGDLNLGGFSLKAKNGAFTGDVLAGSVSATNFVGDGSKLTGVALAGTACAKAGEVVSGVAADGSLVCVTPKGATLPANGLGTVSNGALSNEFTESASGPAKVAIPDNTGSEAASQLTFPDIGVAKTFAVKVKVENTDLSSLSLKLLPPDDKKTGWTLCDPCGKKDAKVLDVTYDVKNPPKSGDLGKWTGQNPKGTWTLKALDIAFCVPQAPGNAKYCDTQNKTDGWIDAFTVTMDSISSAKVEAKGALLASGGFRYPIFAKEPYKCDKAHYGYSYLNSTNSQVYICTDIWRRVLLQECGNGVLESGEQCDNGQDNSDTKANACRTTCVKATCGDGVTDSGELCDDGNKNDNDGCKNTCVPPCTGWLYKGVCLKASTLSGNSDNVPSGCQPYQPTGLNWTQSDFIAICNQFKTGSTNCSALDSDSDGGRCSNYKALASWEPNGTPDIWVHSTTFGWKPTSGGQNCNIYSQSGTRAVYACK